MQNILRIVLMETADTHWYCKCVAMIDIFLRLYNIEDMFRTQICHYSACLLKTGMFLWQARILFANLRLQNVEWRPPEWPYFLLHDQEAGKCEIKN